MDGEIDFTIEGYLVDKDGTPISNTSIKLLECRIYNWKPRTGGAEDILGEEGRGYALDWDFSEFGNPSP